MTMKISAIVLIGIVLISIYIKNNDEGLVFRRNETVPNNNLQNINFKATQSLIEKSINSHSFRILEYPNQPIDLDNFLKSISRGEDNLVIPAEKTLFVFWAMWCPNCKENLINLNRNLKTKNLKIYAINLDVLDDRKKASDFWKSLALPFQTFYDSEKLSLKKFNLEILPSYVLIQKNKLLYRIEGNSDWSDPKLQKIL